MIISRRIASMLMLALTTHVYAISDNAGTKNGNFLKLATDARGVVLGDTSVTSADGVAALRWNPRRLGNTGE